MLDFDYDSIRDDFVGKYHDSFIRNTEEQFSLRKKPNFVLGELERLRMLGVWRQTIAIDHSVASDRPAAIGSTTCLWANRQSVIKEMLRDSRG